ncbi:MAG: tripartite tricarboxylate transporter TctB family protein [Alphaproteobacteria bacterium]|nr:tripartite tricarboxylate transporter TctB family protein [Alphaproteobacteria bacterium]MBU1551375.1 tripartite tricarboxylate transporter TctB family protein [Alphaproteobacteria bacterium]MBU2336526.1 tripartite tricarboxylate transporter TctB family protein [Alphaproteobacteria bacterium]MBU2387940.1 tripartite tricarboxylate transporter TctB family protein [Alphaproteobacteria bacterium]
MKFHESIIGITLVAFGAWVLWQVQSFPSMPGQIVGPATFPSLLAILCSLGGVLLVWEGVRAPRHNLIALHEGWRIRSRTGCVAVAVLGTLLLAVSFERVGFPVGGTLLLVALFYCAGLRGLRWIIVSAAFVLVVHLVMTRLLYVPLPSGFVKGLL